MGNVMGTVLSGFGEILGKLLGHPLDFLAGKACSSVCAPTWDFLCYIENFCISQLLKLAMVSILLYFVVLFLYLLYKLGICRCICHKLCRCTWASFSTCFSVLDCCCTFLCFKLQQLLLTPRRRRRHKKSDIEGVVNISSTCSEAEGEGSFSSRKIDGRRRRRSIREHRKENMRKSLRPKSHRMQVQVLNDSIHPKKRLKIGNSNDFRPVHHIRVSKRPNFAQKGIYKGLSHNRRR